MKVFLPIFWFLWRAWLTVLSFDRKLVWKGTPYHWRIFLLSKNPEMLLCYSQLLLPPLTTSCLRCLLQRSIGSNRHNVHIVSKCIKYHTPPSCLPILASTGKILLHHKDDLCTPKLHGWIVFWWIFLLQLGMHWHFEWTSRGSWRVATGDSAQLLRCEDWHGVSWGFHGHCETEKTGPILHGFREHQRRQRDLRNFPKSEAKTQLERLQAWHFVDGSR